jgi:hypothetical protein
MFLALIKPNSQTILNEFLFLINDKAVIFHNISISSISIKPFDIIDNSSNFIASAKSSIFNGTYQLE